MKTYLWLLLGAVTLASVSCGDDQSPRVVDGSILVGATTIGTDFDQDGYLVSVNSGQGIALPTQDTIWVNALEPGNYTVALAGVAENCTVTAGDNPQDATVVAADTAEVLFEVTCEPPEDGGGGGGEPQP